MAARSSPERLIGRWAVVDDAQCHELGQVVSARGQQVLVQFPLAKRAQWLDPNACTQVRGTVGSALVVGEDCRVWTHRLVNVAATVFRFSHANYSMRVRLPHGQMVTALRRMARPSHPRPFVPGDQGHVIWGSYVGRTATVLAVKPNLTHMVMASDGQRFTTNCCYVASLDDRPPEHLSWGVAPTRTHTHVPG